MTQATRKIKTEFIYPPIPDRRYDWCAYDENTYDGPGCPVGYGETEQQAIDDLFEMLGEQRCKNCGSTNFERDGDVERCADCGR